MAVAKKKTKKAAAKPASEQTITLKSISEDLAEVHGLTKKQMNEILNDFSTTLTKTLKKGSRIRWSGIGTFQVKKRAARKGRNPATGEVIKIAASKNVAFKSSKDLKEAVGNKKKKK